MRSRQELAQLVTHLSRRAVPDVRSTFEALRDDLAETLADLAADVLLHQEACDAFRDELPSAAFASPAAAEVIDRVAPGFWSLVFEDFRRLAVWLPRQRLARFGEEDVIRCFRDRLVAALRPAVVELQRYGVLPNGGRILDEEFWDARDLYDLSVRYEAFSLELCRAIEGRIRADQVAQRTIRADYPTDDRTDQHADERDE